MASHSCPPSLPRTPFIPPATAHDARRREALVVEGSRSVRSTIVAALERAGCVAIEASRAEEGWFVALNRSIDLLVVSHSLPRMTGAELIQLLRASQFRQLREVPTIGLSQGDPCEQALRTAGVEAIVRRPYREADLLRAIRRVADVHWFTGCQH